MTRQPEQPATPARPASPDHLLRQVSSPSRPVREAAAFSLSPCATTIAASASSTTRSAPRPVPAATEAGSPPGNWALAHLP
jgi:hypothetical protein